jgi:hypothetical protein
MFRSCLRALPRCIGVLVFELLDCYLELVLLGLLKLLRLDHLCSCLLHSAGKERMCEKRERGRGERR